MYEGSIWMAKFLGRKEAKDERKEEEKTGSPSSADKTEG
jgi:hypothetical protein